MRVRKEAVEALRAFFDEFLGFEEDTPLAYVRYWQSNQHLPTVGELFMLDDFTVLCHEAKIAPRPTRTHHPVCLPEAGRLSKEPAASLDPVNVVLRLKGMPRITRFRKAMQIDHEHGPSRMDGDVGLLYIAFVASGEVRLKRWWRSVVGYRRLWRACDFARPISYPLLAERFAELERFKDLFVQMVAELVQAARRRMPEIGAHVTIDGTECETHARLLHACPDGYACPDRHKSRKSRVKRVDAGTATQLRQDMADTPTDEVEAPTSGQASTGAASEDGLMPVPANGARLRTSAGELRAWGGHWWLCRDPDAGLRAYDNGTVWLGYMHIKVVDVATGVVLAVLVIPASEQEHLALPDAFDRLVQTTGIKPIALGADRGYGFDAVHEFLARQDTGAVIPYRKRSKASPDRREETDLVDVHGIPKCPGCGEPGDIVKTSGANGQPRTWFECSLKATPECDGVHSISSSKDWRSLVLVPRTSTTYGVVRGAVNGNERAHEFMREHFAVGGKTLRERPRRIGIACQQMRSDAALVITWLLVLQRQGWLERGVERAAVQPMPIGGYTKGVRSQRRRLSLFGGSAPTRGAPSERVAA